MPHYSLSTFLRQTPRPLLRAYFDHHAILADLDFTTLKRTATEPIVEAIRPADIAASQICPSSHSPSPNKV